VLFLLSFIFGVVPVKLAQLFKWSESLNPDNTADNKIIKTRVIITKKLINSSVRWKYVFNN